MLSGLNILIVSENQLQAIGLRSILQDYFSPESVVIASSFDHRTATKADVLFISSDIIHRYYSSLVSLQKKTVVLLNPHDESKNFSAYKTISVRSSESTLIERLENLFTSFLTLAAKRSPEELSSREIEVLKLVARGYLNKEIANALSISLHTVISHRKNITRKLGIKTVPGLTLYALMNGLISSSDIQ